MKKTFLMHTLARISAFLVICNLAITVYFHSVLTKIFINGQKSLNKYNPNLDLTYVRTH